MAKKNMCEIKNCKKKKRRCNWSWGLYELESCIITYIPGCSLGNYCNTFAFINDDSLKSPAFKLLDCFHVTAEGPSTVLASSSHKNPVTYSLYMTKNA